ncbi:MAG: CHAT domain-containing protein [Oscillatoria sp. SIO1A7]|nr:CHAT domain-containing protein [Oscillatoria sp. SIO1A7]
MKKHLLSAKVRIIAAIAASLAALSPFLPVARAQDTEALRQAYQYMLNNFEQNLAEARQSGNDSQVVDTLSGGAIANQYFGNFQKASDLLMEALKIARAIEDRGREQSVLYSLASVRSKLGDDYGIEFLEGQLEETARDKESQRIILENLGLAYRSVGNFNKAIPVYHRNLELTRELEPKGEKEVWALFHLGTTYANIQDYDRSLEILEEGVSLAREIKNIDLANTFMTWLAIGHKNKGNYPVALGIFQEALQLAEEKEESEVIFAMLGNIADIYIAQEEWQKAKPLQERRLEIARSNQDKISEYITLEALGEVYFWSGDIEKAIELQKEAIAATNAFYTEGDNHLLGLVLDRLGFLLLRAGKLKEAERTLRSAIEAYDNQRKQFSNIHNLFSMSQDDINLSQNYASSDSYRSLQQALIAQNRSDEALEAAEQGRGRAFAELLLSRLEAESQAEFDNEPLSLEEMKQIARREKTTIVQYSVLYDYNWLYRGRLGVNNPKTGQSSLYIWVIKPSGEVVFRQVRLGRPLQELVRDARNFIALQARRPINLKGKPSPLQEIYSYAIAPIAEELPTDPRERVTFIPHDALFLVPFPALQDANKNYLIEQHTILTAPSIRVLDLARQQKDRSSNSGSSGAFVVGNPTMPMLQVQLGKPPIQLAPLPGAELEAKAIAEMLGVEPLIGSQATKAAVVRGMRQARLIHLATHGLLETKGFHLTSLLSSLALAPAGDDDGFLTAREIMELDLNAELAVLSACDTGRGAITGDGVVGLSRSFIAAGVPTVLVSLWAVPDAPTATLMTQFYQALQGGVDKATALRQAILATKQQFPEIQAWGPFTAIGVAE